MAHTSMPSADLIQDITTRFILTAPAEQLMFFESIMFLVEQAHWYYEDYVRDQDSSLRSLGLKEFAIMVFENCPELSQHLDDIEQIMEHFKAFKKNVPVMGGILLDQDMQRVLLVKGWKNSACWGFPRGKIHKNETDAQCAVREVLEETGYDIEELVCEDDFIELTLDGKRNKLYIVAGLDPNSAQFAPKCKGEIGGYAWHRVADLPSTRDEGNQTFLSEDGTKHKFFMVWPYLKPLRKWIKKQQRGKQPDGVWDMPQILTTPTPQQQQRGKQPDDLWDMPQILTTPTPQQQQCEQARGGNGSLLQPVMSQQVQQLAHSERRSGTGSPKYMQHHQFHEAAIAQARQQAAVSTGTLPAPSIPVGTTPSAGRSGGSATGASSSTQDISCSPLVKLFGSATVARVGSSNDMLSSSPGQAFKFNRQPILHALTSPAGAAGVPLRHQISGRG